VVSIDKDLRETDTGCCYMLCKAICWLYLRVRALFVVLLPCLLWLWLLLWLRWLLWLATGAFMYRSVLWLPWLACNSKGSQHRPQAPFC
jgi:hypothetical protein